VRAAIPVCPYVIKRQDPNLRESAMGRLAVDAQNPVGEFCAPSNKYRGIHQSLPPTRQPHCRPAERQRCDFDSVPKKVQNAPRINFASDAQKPVAEL
jgi:hypothetical protein